VGVLILRVFKVKSFLRFQRGARIEDDALARAVELAESGLVDADLGGGVIKQRVARSGEGKRGGYRTIVAYRRGHRAVFLFGFGKSERSNIRHDELTELQAQSRVLLRLSDDQVQMAMEQHVMMEVEYGGKS
jgi:hypothetical protein